MSEHDIILEGRHITKMYGGVKALARIAEKFNKEMFVLNIPYEKTPENIDYLVSQYGEMIDFITDKTGRKLDEQALKDSIRLNNEGRKYLLEAYDFCKSVPSPSRSDDWKNFIIYVLLSGTKEGVEVAKTYRDELRQRSDDGIAGKTAFLSGCGCHFGDPAVSR